MFDELVDSGEKKRTNKPWTVVLSAIVQTLILGVLVLIPLIYTEALPKNLITTFLVAPAPPPPPPPPAAAVIKIVKPQVHLLHNGQLITPSVIPKKVSIIKEEAEPPDMGGGVVGGVMGGVPGGSANGVLGGIIGSVGNGLPPPPPKASNKPYRVGGNVMEAKKTRNVLPVYPQIAKTAHIQGTVLLHAIIDKDGSIQELQYISGPPLLMRAAMDAVRQWKYQPTLLNGEAVSVDTSIQVIFSLGG
jgi:protein TonB